MDKIYLITAKHKLKTLFEDPIAGDAYRTYRYLVQITTLEMLTKFMNMYTSRVAVTGYSEVESWDYIDLSAMKKYAVEDIWNLLDLTETHELAFNEKESKEMDHDTTRED